MAVVVLAIFASPQLAEAIPPKYVYMREYNRNISYMEFGLDGKTLATIGVDGSMMRWNIITGIGVPFVKPRVDGDGVFHKNLKTLIARGGVLDYRIHVWDLTSGKERMTWSRGGDSEIFSLALSPDGKTLAVGDDEGRIELWETTTGNVRKKLRTVHKGRVEVLRFSADGKLLASGGVDKIVRLWELPTGKLRASFKGHRDKICALAFSPSRKILASVAQKVRLWNVDTEASVATLSAPKFEDFQSVAYSPDGKTLAAGAGKGAVFIWDCAGDVPKHIKILRGHFHVDAGVIFALEFSPDGKILASAGGDLLAPFPVKKGDKPLTEAIQVGDLKLWDTATWRECTPQVPKEQK